MIAGRIDKRGTFPAVAVVPTQGVLVTPSVSGVGVTSYAQLPQQLAGFTSIQGWAAFRVTVP